MANNWMTHDAARARKETNRINSQLDVARHAQETGQWPATWPGATSASPKVPNFAVGDQVSYDGTIGIVDSISGAFASVALSDGTYRQCPVGLVVKLPMKDAVR